ncbi:MAG: hypothetical protein ACYTHK_18865 [Planctomycetota bacterium]|jgi:predicted amidophosphoribosyltransferase
MSDPETPVCPHCFEPYEIGDDFCPKCGKPVGEATSSMPFIPPPGEQVEEEESEDSE